MTTLKTILVIPILLLLLSSECRKENKDTLPPETQDGKNTFGCLINGQLFREGGSSFSNVSLVADLSDNSTLSVSARNGSGNNLQFVGFSINNMVNVGKYNLSGKNSGNFSNLNGNTFCKFLTDSLDGTGYVKITYLDTIRKVVSGTFSFKAKYYQSALGTCDSSSIIDVKEGRFDVIYLKH